MSAASPVAIVTGASSGIGRATALLLARSGYRVFATVRSEAGEAALRESAGTLALEVLRLDGADEGAAGRVVQQVLQEASRIDVLVNNAAYGQLGAVEDLSRATLRHQFEVNVFGPMELTRDVLPTMRAQRHGRIVNVSSLAGRVSIPLMGAYCASKFALEAFSDALRAEVRQFGIRVAIVEPGPVATSFQQLSRAESRPVLTSPSIFRIAYERILNEGPERHPATAEQVARVILRAVRSGHPRSRYRVRLRESLAAALVSVIPRGAIDWATVRWMGVLKVEETRATDSCPPAQ